MLILRHSIIIHRSSEESQDVVDNSPICAGSCVISSVAVSGDNNTASDIVVTLNRDTSKHTIVSFIMSDPTNPDVKYPAVPADGVDRLGVTLTGGAEGAVYHVELTGYQTC